jgi:hypothetical protein
VIAAAGVVVVAGLVMGVVEVAGLAIDAHAAAVAASSGLGAPVAFNCVFDGDGIE